MTRLYAHKTHMVRLYRQLGVLLLLSRMCAAPDPSTLIGTFNPSSHGDVRGVMKGIADSLIARVQHIKQGRLMLNPFTGYHRVGPAQQLIVTHPTGHETQRMVQWPVCVFGRAALLATFCVQETTQLMEKDPANLLPRVSLSVEPQKPSSATVFLIDGSDGSFQRAFPYAGSKNESAGCETVMRASTATIFPAADSGHAVGSRALRGSKPTKWYLVAVDCSKPRPACPNISQAVITTYHPNTEAEPDSCTFGGSSALNALMSLQNLMSEVSQMEMPDPLHVVGVGAFGVAVLYSVLFVMLASAFLFGTLSRVEPDETKKQVHLRSSFAVALMGLCYLTLATGNGLVILRRTGKHRGVKRHHKQHHASICPP